MKLGINDRLKGKRLYREVWKPVVLLDTGESYEGLYEVSNMGRVRSLDREVNYRHGKRIKKGRILKQTVDKKGYSYVNLYKDKKSKMELIHRLVGFAFHSDTYFEGACIDHIIPVANGGKNIWTNLKWVTHKENSNNPLSLQNASESHKGCIPSEETRKKMSESHKGKHDGELNHMFGRTGELNPFYGQHHSEETLKKLSKRVRCIETGIIYPSIKEASRQTGISDGSICSVCKGKRESVRGYHWEYVTEEEVS